MSTKWADIAMPFGQTLGSFCTAKDDAAVLKSSVIVILMTRRGEMYMEPDFGSGLPDAVHEQNDEMLVELLNSACRDAIQRWDDRIRFVRFTGRREVNDLICEVVVQDARNSQAPDQIVLPLRFSSSEIAMFNI